MYFFILFNGFLRRSRSFIFILFGLFFCSCGEENQDRDLAADENTFQPMNGGIQTYNPVYNPELEDDEIQGGEHRGGEHEGRYEGGGDQVGGISMEEEMNQEEGGIHSETGNQGGLEGGILDEMDGGIDVGQGGENALDMMSQNVCDRLRSVLDESTPPNWMGNPNQCIAGEMGMDAQESVLRITNFYRSLANLNPVTLATQGQAELQECALMMEANRSISHTPPSSWNCYTEGGMQKAGQSNLATTNALDAVALYMIDRGNETTMGHRRWIMSKGLQTIGLGSTNEYSCMEVLHLNRQPGWVAYPPAGEFPIQILSDRWSSIDQTGWTIQMNGISGQNPVVEVSVNGTSLPVEVNELLPNYGSERALNLIPQGWTSEAGTSYRIRVSGLSEEIDYTVDMIDCGF